jgi:hypothetical protein
MVLPGVLDSSYLDSGTPLWVSKRREIHTTFKMGRAGTELFLMALALGHDGGTEFVAQRLRQIIDFLVAVDLDGGFCRLKNNKAVVAPMEVVL